MIQANKYKKECYLTDAEKNKVNEFFKELCKVDNITNIEIYIDDNGNVICEVEGFEKPKTTLIGSAVLHDIEE